MARFEVWNDKSCISWDNTLGDHTLETLCRS